MTPTIPRLSTYSGNKIFGIVHPHTKGCDGHVPLQGNFNTKSLPSCVNTSNVHVGVGAKRMLAYQEVSKGGKQAMHVHVEALV